MINKLTRLVDDADKYWLIDVDNTVYSETDEISRCIQNGYVCYLAYKCRCTTTKAVEINFKLYSQYGHSIIGAYKENIIQRNEIDEFFDFVHSLPIEDKLTPNKDLLTLISKVKGKKYIFSNASKPYIERILNKLKINDKFEDVWDIYRLKFECKPKKESFEMFKDQYSINYSDIVFVDDSSRNLASAQELGIHCYHPNAIHL